MHMNYHLNFNSMNYDLSYAMRTESAFKIRAYDFQGSI